MRDELIVDVGQTASRGRAGEITSEQGGAQHVAGAHGEFIASGRSDRLLRLIFLSHGWKFSRASCAQGEQQSRAGPFEMHFHRRLQIRPLGAAGTGVAGYAAHKGPEFVIGPAGTMLND